MLVIFLRNSTDREVAELKKQIVQCDDRKTKSIDIRSFHLLSTSEESLRRRMENMESKEVKNIALRNNDNLKPTM